MPLNSIPSTTTVAALGGEASRRRGAMSRRRRVLGRRRARQRRAISNRWRAPACWASSASSAHPASTSSRTSANPICARRCRSWRPRACRCWRTRNGRRCCASPIRRADPRRYATWLATRPPAAEHAAIELLDRLAGARRGARSHRPSGVGRRTAGDRQRRAPRRDDHRRDLSALPDVLRRRDRRPAPRH